MPNSAHPANASVILLRLGENWRPWNSG